MARQENFGDTSLMSLVRHVLRKFGEFRIRQEWRIVLRQVPLENAIEILAFQMIEAAIVEVVQRAVFDIHAVDGDGGLAMFGAIAHAVRIRHEEAVHLHHAQATAPDLGRNMALDVVEDRKFRCAQAVKRLEVFQRHLEKVNWSPSKSCVSVKPSMASGAAPKVARTSIQRST